MDAVICRSTTTSVFISSALLTVSRGFCHRSLISLGLALYLGVYSDQSFAEIYKWTDARGIVHYSDQRVEGARRLDTADAPLPVNVYPGLSNNAREHAAALQKQTQLQRAKEQREEELRQREKERLVEKHEQRCRHYSGIQDKYRRTLRRGCSVRQCREIKDKMADNEKILKTYCG